MLRPFKELRYEVGAVKIFLKGFAEFDATGDIGAQPIVEHEEAAQGRAKAVVVTSHVQRLRIGEANVRALSEREGLIYLGYGLLAA